MNYYFPLCFAILDMPILFEEALKFEFDVIFWLVSIFVVVPFALKSLVL
jgi:hypothetical protein